MKKNLIRILLLLFCLLIWAWQPGTRQAPAEAETGREQTDVFTPSESLPADRATAFPVDI